MPSNPIPVVTKFIQNTSSSSYDLLITNVADNNEGVCYCGTIEKKTEKIEKITPGDGCRCNITTRLTI
ncbi:unnamed protein product, partial [Menidia menidia]